MRWPTPTAADPRPAERPALPPPRFDTTRLRLRTLRADDERLYMSLYTDPDVMRHVGEPLSDQAAARALDLVLRQMRQSPPAAWYWVVRMREEPAAIGLLAMVFDQDAGSAELGMLLGPAARGRGYATEAVGALVGHALAWPGRGCLRVRHLADHPCVPRVLDKLGFVPEGVRHGMAHWRLDR